MIFYVFKWYRVVYHLFDLISMKVLRSLSLFWNVKNSDLGTLKN